MRVTTTTTSISFIPRNAISNPRVIITNEVTGVVLFDKVVFLFRDSYFYKVKDNFDFEDGEEYILEVIEDNILEYRANIECNNRQVRNNYTSINAGESDNNYIKI